MPKRKRTALSPKEAAESAGFVAGFVGFLLTYTIAEVALAPRPHPYHWLVAAAGALLIAGAAYGLTRRQARHRRP